MPLPKGTRFRYKKGTKIRLAFAPNSKKVIEVKDMATGKVHNEKHAISKIRGRKR